MTDELIKAEPVLHVSTGPHLRQGESVPGIMISVLCALIPAMVAGVIFFGFHALILFIVCIATSVGTEALLCIIFKKPQSVKDFSALVTGVLLACSLPPQCPPLLAAMGSMFAIALVKIAFGGLGNSFVNPALAGRAFLLVSFPTYMTRFCAPLHGTMSGLDAVTTATPLSFFKTAISSGNFQVLDLQEALPNLFFGNVGGCVGETSAAALLLGAIFLFYKGVIRFRISGSFIGTVFLLFWIFNGTGSFFSTESIIIPFYQILSGGLFLGAFFMATDPVTSSVTPIGKIIFGAGCGVFTFLLRIFGNYPEGVGFAILLMNLAVPLIDSVCRPKSYGKVARRERHS